MVRGRRWTGPAAACAAAIVALVALAAAVSRQAPDALDAAARAWVVAHRVDAVTAVAAGVSHVTSLYVLAPVALLAAWRLSRRGGAAAGVPLVLAPLAARLLSSALKALLDRPRPPGADGTSLGASFPSTHATSTAAVALTLAYVLARERPLPRPALAARAAAVVAVAGVSRVLLDVHWVTDVVAGWALGIAIAAACAVVYELIRAARPVPDRGAPPPPP